MVFLGQTFPIIKGLEDPWDRVFAVATQVTSSLYLVRLWVEPRDGDDANANAASHPL